jgi:hypothetical protein
LPKARLATEADFESWWGVWGKGVRGGKYVACVARDDRMLILIPAVTSDPIIYAYMVGVMEEQALKLVSKYNIPAFAAAQYDWESDKTRARVEE